MLELSIVVPCRNEERTIALCVQEAHTFLNQAAIHGEILVVDNGSSDRSTTAAISAGAAVVSCSNIGYGAALMQGIACARGRFIAMGDADGSYNFTELLPFMEKLRNGADLVVGSRFKGRIERGAMPGLHRYIGNPLFSMVGRTLFGTGISDIYCGLRAFDAERVRALRLQAPGMEFAVEMVLKAAQQSYRIEECPVTLRPDGRDRRPHLRTWRDGLRTLGIIVKTGLSHHA